MLAVACDELTLVMEYYPSSLTDVIAKHKGKGVPMPTLLHIAKGIAAGMLYVARRVSCLR